MLGYWQRPDATDEIIKDGWLHTGDIAVMDDEASCASSIAKKDMILVSGFNVYPERNRRRGDAAQRRAGSGGGGRSFRQQR